MALALRLCAAALVLISLAVIIRKDWLRLTRAAVRVDAVVVGHRSTLDEGHRLYAARFAFEADGQPVEVVDQRLYAHPQPAVGERVRLSYPAGHPELAHIPRPIVWTAIYIALLALLAVLGLQIFERPGWIIGS